MYLLNAQQISKHVQSPRGQYLDIENYDERSLQHTSYYFRLGEQYELLGGTEPQIMRLTEDKPYLNLGPNGYAVVKSHEIFILSDKLIGIFGQRSRLAAQGLELVHSPFIDPLFRGRLVLGLSNRLPVAVRLRLGQIIGKVSFFDISDTYPVQVIAGSIIQETFDRRRPQRDDDPVPSWVEVEEPDDE
jgi:deoxycytidine triphosphate deaminase